MSAAEATEADVLETVLPRFEAQGFEVFVNPSPSILPSFMDDYRPDAVALRSDKKIAFEVVRSNRSSDDRIKRLQSLFAPHGEWEFRILYVTPRTAEDLIEVASPAAIEAAIQRVNDLKNADQYVPA